MKMTSKKELGLVGVGVELTTDQLRVLADMISPIQEKLRQRSIDSSKRKDESEQEYELRLSKHIVYRNESENIYNMFRFIRTIVGGVPGTKDVLESLFINDEEEHDKSLPLEYKG